MARSSYSIWSGVLVVLSFGLVVEGTSAEDAYTLSGSMMQGGMIVGRTAPGTEVVLDGKSVQVSRDGVFVFGFGRDAAATSDLQVKLPWGESYAETLSVAPQSYAIERIEGLPPAMVTPPPEVTERINRENRWIGEVRAQNTDASWFLDGFSMPAEGRLSGFYGSQRILNGEPRWPHFGLDVAAAVGTPIVAPAPGVVALAEDDLYYTGGTVMLDHGMGITSVYSHMSSIDVMTGDKVERGDKIGEIGATGRVTGPHLDWRVNWFAVRLDPKLLVAE